MAELSQTERHHTEPMQWLAQHGDALYAYAARQVADEQDRADVVQETFVAAIQNQQDFSERSAVRTWLIGILKNKIADYFRKRGKQESESDSNYLDDYFDHKGRWQSKPGRWGSNWQSALDRSEFAAALRQCLEGLPHNARSAFVLRECEQQNSEEICQVLNVSATNLWQLLSRARQQLRNCLEHNWFRKPTKD